MYPNESYPSESTIALAQKESAEHLLGLDLIHEAFCSRNLTVKAYSLDSDAPVSSDPGRTKIIHLVRHGQAFHNLLADKATELGIAWQQFVDTPENPYVAPELLDAPLTEKGRQQALSLRHKLETLSHTPQIVVVSPLCRTLQTALLAFTDLIGRAPFVAHELVREETGVHRCDQRRSRDLHALEFPHVDFGQLASDQDAIFDAHRRESKQQVAERIYAFLEWLEQRPEEHILVTSHSGWLLTLMNAVVDVAPEDSRLKEWFQTGEMRSCKFTFHRMTPDT